MTEQNSLDKFRSKEVEERFQELISGVVNEEFENMNTALDPQPVGCSKDGTECRIRFIKKDWERNQRMQVHGGGVSDMNAVDTEGNAIPGLYVVGNDSGA